MKYVLLLLTLIATPAFADFGATVGLGSNYIFRGVGQNSGDPSAFGDVNFSAGGFYAGVWAGQVDYGTETDVEYDLYVGKEFTAGDITVDVSYIDYNYSSFDALTDFEESDLDVEEVAVSVGYKAITASYFAGLSDAPDYMQLSVDLGVADVTVGDYDTVGQHYMVSKTIDVEGVDVTFGYRQFFAEDDVSDEKSAILMVSKSF